MTLSGGFGDEELPALSERLDPDDHAFYAVSSDGAREPVSFDLGGDHDDLFVRRHRLRRS